MQVLGFSEVRVEPARPRSGWHRQEAEALEDVQALSALRRCRHFTRQGLSLKI
jgi:hypothetical protein